jgi:hypothetical protein
VTIVEFMTPLRKSGSRQDRVIAVLFYSKHHAGTPQMTTADIRAGLQAARIPNAKSMNVSDVVAKAAPLIYAPGDKRGNALLYQLTDTGEKHAREVLSLPLPTPDVELVNEATSLKQLSAKISDEVIRGYVDEAILCLEVGALRAAIVFLWTAAIRDLHEQALKKNLATVNAAIAKRDPKAPAVKKLEDFAYVKDRVFLDATPDMSLLDKGQKGTMVDALDLRNKCGHPTKYKPGINKARSFIEDVVGIVWN